MRQAESPMLRWLLQPQKIQALELLMLLCRSMPSISRKCRLNLNFKWKEAKSPCRRKVGHMQMRKSSVVQSFISEVGSPESRLPTMFGGASIFFKLDMGPTP